MKKVKTIQHQRISVKEQQKVSEGFCKNCCHWSPVGQVGECHRYAPSPTLGEKKNNYERAVWVITQADDFCGDFASK